MQQQCRHRGHDGGGLIEGLLASHHLQLPQQPRHLPRFQPLQAAPRFDDDRPGPGGVARQDMGLELLLEEAVVGLEARLAHLLAQGLAALQVVAHAARQRRVALHVGGEPCFKHEGKDLLGNLSIATPCTSSEQRVVVAPVDRHALLPHLHEEAPRGGVVALPGTRGHDDLVSNLSPLRAGIHQGRPHLLECRQGLVSLPRSAEGLDQGGVGDDVRLQTSLTHLLEQMLGLVWLPASRCHVDHGRVAHNGPPVWRHAPPNLPCPSVPQRPRAQPEDGVEKGCVWLGGALEGRPAALEVASPCGIAHQRCDLPQLHVPCGGAGAAQPNSVCVIRAEVLRRGNLCPLQELVLRRSDGVPPPLRTQQPAGRPKYAPGYRRCHGA
mmetsp:Transcript_84625/g.272729  ORF Transcript_84625/g.272729 Transcript_84625/m.272729 type:complete len:381 (+) Transcript_84625:418-1560(+)